MNFKDYGANQTMIDSTLSGFTPGEIFDDLIVTNAGFTFGCINHAREFSRKHNRNLFLIKNNRLNIPEKYILRREYTDIKFQKANIGTKFKIAAFDPFQSNWPDSFIGIWGSVRNYKKNGLGVGIFNNNIQISEAMVGYIGKKHTEIGTITHLNYRKMGLSTLASSMLVEKLISNKIQPSWSCNEDNTGSWKIAEKIGFMNFKTYYFYVIEP